ncbi:4175_t:CDS:2 [Acaulospora colombiana]|uniref:4175_t:CDS:1 n=1 Tax=Acaulospora colombiana TaxID=27376 RepID=A0ACA9LST3_9GLOM|nr:4175_t:CDS:2 [Acaulospora colombiana]
MAVKFKYETIVCGSLRRVCFAVGSIEEKERAHNILAGFEAVSDLFTLYVNSGAFRLVVR